MIKIIIELWPHGVESRKKIIASAKIWNNLTGTSTKGNYFYDLKRIRNGIWRTGKINGFRRKRLNIWYLLLEILKDALDVDVKN